MPEEKLRVLAAAQGLEGEELGALLRREGLHEVRLREWRQATAGALTGVSSGGLTANQRRRLAASEKRVKELERELRRKEMALAETAALLPHRLLARCGTPHGREDIGSPLRVLRSPL